MLKKPRVRSPFTTGLQHVLTGCWGPRAGRAYIPKRNSSYLHSVPNFLFGILCIGTPNLMATRLRRKVHLVIVIDRQTGLQD
eukprot:748925-Prymnesium_polylepis.1